MDGEIYEIPQHMLRLGQGALAHAVWHANYYSMSNALWSELSVIQAAHAAEILIKARIADEHPLLIFETLPELRPRVHSRAAVHLEWRLGVVENPTLQGRFRGTNGAMQDRVKIKKEGCPSGPKREANDLYVVPAKGGWAVRNGSSSFPARVYPTQAAATKAATESLRRNGSGTITIQGRDGRFRESFVVSRGDFEKVSAIEGLSLSAEMKRDFDAFDRTSRTDAQRRKAILRKYAKQGV